MYSAELRSFGPAPEVVVCAEVPEPDAPGPGEVLLAVQASPINPADILLVEGKYATRPALPAPLGIEGAGRILAVGEGVEHLAVGDRVMSLARTNWAEQRLLQAGEVMPLPPGLDIRQAAMLKVNPATAMLMLRNFVELKAGDWVIQNAANSGVGLCCIELARRQRLHTVNVVRRESLVAPLRERGADVVLVDGEDLPERMREATGGQLPGLAIDAVGGTATGRLARCLADGGTVVNYGVMSGEDCVLGFDRAVFHDIALRGFWLARTLPAMPPGEVQALYRELAGIMAEGGLQVPVAAVYPLSGIKEALAHARREARGGKVLLSPDGSLSG